MASHGHSGQARRPRLLYYLEPAGYGGAVRYIEQLVAHVDSDKYDLALLAPDEQYLGPLRHAIRARGGIVHDLPRARDPKHEAYLRVAALRERRPIVSSALRSPLIRGAAKTALAILALRRDASQLAKLTLLLGRTRADLVHVNLDHFPDNTGRLAVIAAKRGGACGVVATIHAEPQLPMAPAVLSHYFDRAALASSDATILVGDTFRAPLVRLYSAPEVTLRTIPNGVAAGCFSPPSTRVSRAALGLGQEDAVVMHVGSISRNRGQHILIEAAARLSADWPHLRVVFVGGEADPDYAAMCRSMAGRILPERTVVWAGYRQDAPALWTAADVAVVSSLTEAHPFALLEAMACARPVVASAVGAIPETVVHGTTGFLVAAGDAPALAERIVELLGSPERRVLMGSAGRARATALYTEDRMWSRTEAVYRELWNRSHRQ